MNYRELIDLINYHNKLYYDDNCPQISDQEYDSLYDALVSTEKSQGWAEHDSPTRKIGGSAGVIKHKYNLYSLRKVYNVSEIDDNFTVCTPKVDGANLTLTFSKGKLANMLTRGDGQYGDDVSHLFPYLLGIPDILPDKDITITGECVTLNNVENYRNYVSGALGLKDPEEFKNRRILFIAHDWLGIDLKYSHRMNKLSEMGFTTVLHINENDFPTDGLVYRIDNIRDEKSLGYTSKYPRFAVALKERGSLTATTILQDIDWIVGRTGMVTPTGIVEPVVLDDATISRVTLHNISIVEDNSLKPGDVIEIERAGGVIPKFIKKITDSTISKEVTISDIELEIGCKTKRIGPRLYVEDSHKNINRKNLENFIKNMDIKGLGPRSVDKLGLKHISDIYKKIDWSILGANGAKIAEYVEISKNKPFRTVLGSLGIPGVGKSTAIILTRCIMSFKELKNIENYDIKGIGDKTKTKILNWIDINEEWVNNLPLNMEEKETTIDIFSPATKKVCVTGKMDMTKNDLHEHLIKYNFSVVPELTQDCYLLINANGEKGTSKVAKAEKYGIKVIDYWQNKADILKGMI